MQACWLVARYAQIPRQRTGVEEVEIEVVMGAVDVVADEPACGAADEHVRRKVLLGKHTADADAGGESIDCRARKPAGVFIANDGGHCPGSGSVVGGKDPLKGEALKSCPSRCSRLGDHAG